MSLYRAYEVAQGMEAAQKQASEFHASHSKKFDLWTHHLRRAASVMASQATFLRSTTSEIKNVENAAEWGTQPRCAGGRRNIGKEHMIR